MMAAGTESDSSVRTREYFSRLYQENGDPWNYESSEYETEKYEASLRALPRKQYQSAFEIGCSIGVFTAKLAPLCKRLLSVDLSNAVLKQAKERCQQFPHVTFKAISITDEYPTGPFDLTVLSEVGYYLEPEALAQVSDNITIHAGLQAHLLLVHWLAPVLDYPLRGDDVHEHFLHRSEWHSLLQFRTEFYRLDVLERRDESDS
ncbi:MAG: SAM-dependent methyltransferase [Bryobacteraceae bacterium]|jgi:SAM-dependent methyltransferase